MECAVHTKTRSRDAGTCNSQDEETRLDPNSLCVYYVRRILPCSRIFPEDTLNVDVLHDTLLKTKQIYVELKISFGLSARSSSSEHFFVVSFAINVILK